MANIARRNSNIAPTQDKILAVVNGEIDRLLQQFKLADALVSLLTLFRKYQDRMPGLTEGYVIKLFDEKARQIGKTNVEILQAHQAAGLIQQDSTTIIQAPTIQQELQQPVTGVTGEDERVAQFGLVLAQAWARVCGVQADAIQFLGHRTLPLCHERAFRFDPSQVSDTTMANKVKTLYSFIPGLTEGISFSRRSGFVVLSEPREFRKDEFELEPRLPEQEQWRDPAEFPRILVGLSEEGAVESVEADSLLVVGPQRMGAYHAIQSMLISLCNQAHPLQLRLVLMGTGSGPSRCFGGFHRSRWIDSANGLPRILDRSNVDLLFSHIETLENMRNAKFGGLGRNVTDYNRDNPNQPFQYVVIAVDDIAPLFREGAAGRTLGHKLMDYVSRSYGSGIIYVLGCSDPTAGFCVQMANQCRAIFHLYSNSGYKALGAARGKKRPELRGLGDGILKYMGVEKWVVSLHANDLFVNKFHQRAIEMFPQSI